MRQGHASQRRAGSSHTEGRLSSELLGSTSKENSHEGDGTSVGQLSSSWRPSPSGVQTNSVAKEPKGGAGGWGERSHRNSRGEGAVAYRDKD